MKIRLGMCVISLGAFILVILSISAPFSQAGPSIQYPATVAFASYAEGSLIAQGDALGPYIHGNDGTDCRIQANDGSSFAGDLILNLNWTHSKVTRYAFVDLDYPVPPANAYGMYRTTKLHIKVQGIGTMPLSSRSQPAYFAASLNDVDHKIRYGTVAGDGTSMVQVTRASVASWDIRTTAQAGVISKLLKSLRNGRLVDMGNFYVPFQFTVTCNTCKLP